MEYTYIKYNRSEMARSLHTKPIENHLLAVIAQRIKYKDDPILKLKARECFMGDYQAIGLTRQSYRTALKNLEDYGFITTKPTNKGTVVTLINNDVYDINSTKSTNQLISDQPTANQQLTSSQPLNKNDNNGKKEKKYSAPVPDGVSVELWEEYLKTRTKLKAPNSKQAITTLTNKLYKLCSQGHKAQDLIATANSSGWKSVFPPAENKIPDYEESPRRKHLKEKYGDEANKNILRSESIQSVGDLLGKLK